MHAVEREITKATKYKVARKFDNRQDYLKSIFLAVQHLTDDDFDDLSDEAAAWANGCVEAQNAGKDEDLPDFDEITPSDLEEEPEEADETEDDPDEAEAEEESDDNDNGETEDDPEPVEVDDEPVDEEPVKRTRKPVENKKTKAAKQDKRIPPKEVKIKVEKTKRHRDGDLTLDKWGCIIGSKNHLALEAFEEGATTMEVKKSIGGTYYNLLAKMTRNGHQVHKEGAIIRLVHKDEVKKISSPKKSKK